MIIFVFQRIYVTGVHNVTVFCSVRSFSLYERRRRKRFAAKIFSGGLNHLPSSCRPWWDRFACHGLVWTECCCCCCCRVVLLFFPPCGWEEEEAETFLQINLQKEREREREETEKQSCRASIVWRVYKVRKWNKRTHPHPIPPSPSKTDSLSEHSRTVTESDAGEWLSGRRWWVISSGL